MKLLSVGLVHETDTFASRPAGIGEFIQSSGGDAAFPATGVRERFEGTATIHGGYIDAAQKQGATLCPLFHAQA